MRQIGLALVGGTIALAACADHAENPAAPELAGGPEVQLSCTAPTSPTRVDSVNITSYGAVSGSDATAAIQAAVNAGRNVYVPAGDFKVSSRITLPPRTRIHGGGSTSRLVQSGTPSSFFWAAGNDCGFVDSLTVEKLAFSGTNSNTYALAVRTARHVTFRDNAVTGLRLIEVTTHIPINYWDGTTDPNATAGLTDTLQLSQNIKVLRNTGTGTYSGTSLNHQGAIFVGHVNGVQADSNTLANYQHGIQYIGGDANPTRGGVITNPRLTRNITIRYNDVRNTEGGIWGGMAKNVYVAHNKVYGCVDVCLDAEGDLDATFTRNEAGNAGGAVLGAFHFNKNLVFSWNTVTQDGSKGGTLFHLNNSSQNPSQISVTLSNNTFRYTGGTGVGTLVKGSAEKVWVLNNTIENAVIDMAPNNGGSVQISGNTLTFTRSTGSSPAINAGNSYGENGAAVNPITGTWHVDVSSNSISSTTAQSGTGIRVEHMGGYHQINSRISDNIIDDFATSVSVAAWRTTDKYFRIEYNDYSGGMPQSATNVSLYGNTYTGGSGWPGDDEPCTPLPGQISCAL